MLKIETAAALEALADPQLRPILARYSELTELAVFDIMKPGNSLVELKLPTVLHSAWTRLPQHLAHSCCNSCPLREGQSVSHALSS